MTWFRMPLFLWSTYATSLIIVLGTPVIAITILLVAAERVFHFGILRSRGRRRPGAVPAPVLVLLASRPSTSWSCRRWASSASSSPRSAASRSSATRSWRSRASAIAVLGFLVWGHHMFVAGQSVYAALVFSILSFLVAIPSAVKVFNWTATMYKGSISWQTPMLYAIGFIGLFTIGGLTGLFLAAIGLDVHVTDTYFIIAHFHYIMVGGTIMGYLGGLHYWWPKISGRLYNEWLAKLARRHHLRRLQPHVLSAVHRSATSGMPRRYHAYPPEFQVLNVLSSAGASILGVGYLIPMVYLMWSLRYGRVAGSNPFRRQRSGVDDDVAAADREFRRDPDRDRGRVRLPVRVETSCCLSARATAAITPALAHQFDDLEQQKEASTLGMWVFLVTEVLFFGGLFAAYSVYRSWYPDAFAAASHEMVVWAGTTNTVGAHHQQPDDGAGGSRGAARRTPRC